MNQTERESETDRAVQILREERARINNAYYRRMGMRRTQRLELGPFLRRMATHPERIPEGRFYGFSLDLNLWHLFDHIRLYNRNGRPFAAISHPYTRLDHDTLKELLNWAANVGLQLCVDADSEYYPGVTVRIILYREGEDFPATDLV